MENKNIKVKEVVRLRQKPLNHGNYSLYLDIYWKGKRAYEFLNLYITPEETKQDKIQNRNTWELAEQIKSRRLIDIQSGKHNVHDSKGQASFIQYVDKLKKDRLNSAGNYGNWDAAYKHLVNFAEGQDLTFDDIDETWLNRFKIYLVEGRLTKGERKLKPNSTYSYYNKIKAALRQAYEEKIILENPATRVKGLKQGDSEREFLTWEEVEGISKHDCEFPMVKNTFLFSVMTGLRFGDIQKMIWSEVRGSNEEGWFIKFQQKKTKDFETLPITSEARNLLGKAGEPDQKVFPGLKYSSHISLSLSRWLAKAGIHRHITFHCARHTHATLLLTQGVDIYVVSKMLGHKTIKTTEIYTKVTNVKKNEAISKLPKLNISLSGS